MTETRSVPCPHCGDTLYQVGMLDYRGVGGKLADSPSLDTDEIGYFMFCPRCSRRVDMEVTSSPTGAGFLPKNR